MSGMKRAGRRAGAGVLIGGLLATGVVAMPSAALAADEDIVINELMYNAPADPPEWVNVEFLELYNKGTAPVDISGWNFSVGITLTAPIPAGTTVPPGGYFVGSSDPAVFQAKFGFAPDFSFAGTGLSGSGETVTLVNGAAAVVDSVAYDDVAPWPVGPDGTFGSLELDDPGDDNNAAANWHASSEKYGTPRAANTIAPLPVSAPVRTPATPDPNQSVRLDTVAPTGSSVSLTYKVMFGADTTVPMLDDAASAGGAGDGTYSATVPGAGAGQLVRFRIAATKGARSGSYPPPGDSRPYDGWVVKDPALGNAQLPVLQWFMPDDVYNAMVTTYRCDGVTLANATFVWNGVVLDGGQMRTKGHSSCSDPKPKWDVELPAGYTFDLGPAYPYPLKKFDLQNEAVPIPRLGWEMIGQAGEHTNGYDTMRIQRNGQFYGVYGVLENYDGTWRSNHGYKDATFYKIEKNGLKTYATESLLEASGDFDKKNPDDTDYSDAWELTQKLAMPDGPAKRAWLMEHLDIPQLVNFTALNVVMRHWDSGTKNFYIAKNPVTGRWQAFNWDLDGILNAGTDPKGDFVTMTTTSNKLWHFLQTDPQILAMHYRRVRTLHDQFLVGNQLVQRYDQLTQAYANDIALDVQKWGGASVTRGRNRVVNGVQERRDRIAQHTKPGEIPVSQSANPQLVINEIHYQPTSADAEYLEIVNPSTTESVDLSGWAVAGLGSFTARAGTVLPAGDHLVWVKNDAAFVAAFGGDHLMAQHYPGSLDDAGETLTLTNAAGATVDTVTYQPTAPWPTAPAGTGPSLELISAASDNALPASWSASQGNGTPAARNSVTTGGGGGGTQTPLTLQATGWRYLATGGDQGTAWRGTSFDDTAWATGRASLGFRNAVLTTIPQTVGRVTYYFRRGFTIPAGGAITGATLRLVRDDGAVVYVNGVEVARSNMPATAGFTTRASAEVSGAAETTPVDIAIPASALREGNNTIAVEVHQYGTATKADLSFDASIVIQR